MSWLDPLRATLATRSAPPAVLIRDDDGGWEHGRLADLVDLVTTSGFHLDLAVIPAAIDRTLAPALRRWNDAGVGVHQHGYTHANHEQTGRKCEFGPSRTREAQRADVAGGQARLADALGRRPDPVFTPPWNRCTRDTALALTDAGLGVLSREHRAAPFDVDGLAEVNVDVDWPREGRRPTPDALVVDMVEALGRSDRLGLMLHHAVMEGPDRQALRDTLRLLAAHGARPVRILDCAPADIGHRA